MCMTMCGQKHTSKHAVHVVPGSQQPSPAWVLLLTAFSRSRELSPGSLATCMPAERPSIVACLASWKGWFELDCLVSPSTPDMQLFPLHQKVQPHLDGYLGPANFALVHLCSQEGGQCNTAWEKGAMQSPRAQLFAPPAWPTLLACTACHHRFRQPPHYPFLSGVAASNELTLPKPPAPSNACLLLIAP